MASVARRGIVVILVLVLAATGIYFGARYRGEIHGTLDGGATWQDVSLPGQVKDIFSLACG